LLEVHVRFGLIVPAGKLPVSNDLAQIRGLDSRSILNPVKDIMIPCAVF
jgi:hypothetical protein